MSSRTAQGQRKRKHQQQTTLRLRGGYGRGGGGVIAVQGDRRTLHVQWNNLADPQYLHWDTGFQWANQPGHYQFPGTDDDLNRAQGWVSYDDGGPPGPGDVGNACVPFSWTRNRTAAEIRPVRALEEQGLQARGRIFYETIQQAPPYTYNEPRWAFKGIQDALVFGSAWTCFEYALTDINVGGIPTGLMLMHVLVEIIEDIKSIANGYVDNNSVCMVYWEGDTDDQMGHGRKFIFTNHAGLQLGHILNDTSFVLDNILYALESDTFIHFRFYRVFVHVITNLGGNSIKNMPKDYLELREGKFYKGMKRGYIAVGDDEDTDSCGIDAIIWALANVLARMKRAYKAASVTVPELCGRFVNFRKKMNSKNLKAKNLFLEIKLQFASYIGWTYGQPLTPDQLCMAVSRFALDTKLDIGLAVFDALYPHSHVTISYNQQAVPEEILCLIYWNFPSVGGIAGGHYDCIDTVNLTTWMQKGIDKRKHLKFSFSQLKMVSSYEADHKGDYCQWCMHFQKDIPSYVWSSGHDGAQGTNRLECSSCGVRFRTLDCMERHRVAPHGLGKAACEKQSLCMTCSRVHMNSYDCTLFFCVICRTTEAKENKETHVCYINSESKKVKRYIPKVIYSDMEGSRRPGYHVAVCIASSWSDFCEEHQALYAKNKCDQCKSSTEWGPWCQDCQLLHNGNECKECLIRQSNIFIGEDCLDKYLEWITTYGAGCTIVFHNGGRYDLHILYVALLKTGKYLISRDATRGTQIVFMNATLACEEGLRKRTRIRFIDSVNFIPASLRSFESHFDLKLESNSKGHFPYDLLNESDWITYEGNCPPPSSFGITEKEYNNPEKLSNNRAAEVASILKYIDDCNAHVMSTGVPWKALDKLVEYTIQDVRVLHAGCDNFRKNFWLLTGADPFHWVTQAAAVAGAFRQEEFMVPKSIQIFSMPDREWQRQGLRGGRCDPIVLYWKARTPTEELLVYDVNSEYPAVQTFGYYPIGGVTLDLKYNRPTNFYLVCHDFYLKTGVQLYTVLQDPTGKSGCGLIECDISNSKAYIPILPYKIKRKTYIKNMFMNRTGNWVGFITVLAEAVKHNQVIINSITRVQYWKNTSDSLFKSFIAKLYGAKVEASGWKKILNSSTITDEDKKTFLAGCEDRGIPIHPELINDNPGKRTTAKLAANCCWGFLTQKPHAEECSYFNNDEPTEVEALGDLLQSLDTYKNNRRLVGVPAKVGKFTRIKTTKESMDITPKEMNRKVAYHVGGQAPAYGLQLLSSAMLSLDPSQPAYCDTDSVFFIHDSENKEHKKIPTGVYLGDFMDEYPGKRITEFVCIGPKSYFIKIEKKNGEVEYKGKFKGIPLCSSAFSLLQENKELAKMGMEEMKKLLFSALKVNNEEEGASLNMTFTYPNFFKRSPDLKIRAQEEKKTIRYTFDKREVIMPPLTTKPEDISIIRTIPWDETTVSLTADDVEIWWSQVPTQIRRYYPGLQTKVSYDIDQDWAMTDALLEEFGVK